MRVYFLITHISGLTREQWGELDSGVAEEDALRSLRSWQGGDNLAPNFIIQMANKLKPHDTNPTLFVRSLFGLDLTEITLTNIPGSPTSYEVRLRNYVRQAIRDFVPGPEQNDYDVSVISFDDNSDPADPKDAVSDVQEWVRDNWNASP